MGSEEAHRRDSGPYVVKDLTPTAPAEAKERALLFTELTRATQLSRLQASSAASLVDVT